MAIAWGVLLPAAILTARYGKDATPHWKNIHLVLNWSCVLCTVAGIWIAISLFEDRKRAHFKKNHHIIGLTVGLWLARGLVVTLVG